MAVERNDVACRDRQEIAQAASPLEPAKHERRNEETCSEHDDDAGHEGTPFPPSAPGGGRRAGEPVDPRVRLESHPRAERESRHYERPDCPPALERARHAEGAGQEEQAEQKVSLADTPCTAAQMVEREENGARRGRGAVTGPDPIDEEQSADRGEPHEIDESPREIARTHDREHGPVNQVDAGHVHVEHVAIGHGALRHQPRDVVHDRRIVNQRPPERSPPEPHAEARATGQNKLQ